MEILTLLPLPVPNAVTSLSKQDWTNSTIALRWTAPQGPGQSSYSYWVSWVREGMTDPRTQSTSGTDITLKELEAGSLYHLTVWAERNEVRGYNSTLTAATGETQSVLNPALLGWGKEKDERTLGAPWEMKSTHGPLQPHRPELKPVGPVPSGCRFLADRAFQAVGPVFSPFGKWTLWGQGEPPIVQHHLSGADKVTSWTIANSWSRGIR